MINVMARKLTCSLQSQIQGDTLKIMFYYLFYVVSFGAGILYFLATEFRSYDRNIPQTYTYNINITCSLI